MEKEEEIQLVEKAKRGDDNAFSQLYEQYYPFLYKYLLKLTLHEDLSKDLAQDTMLKCYKHLHAFNGDSKFSSWMISIASRAYIDSLRKKRRENNWLQQVKTSLSRQLSWASKTKGMEWSHHFLDFNKLEADIRVPILLRHYYGYSYEEIGKMLGIKAGTVKSRVHNGIKLIRKEWTENE
ncbi:RNA polymerase sigma factor SigY [Sutcliffiella cohnii]|uniref:RNA polymerase sigma factor SigY n=1 Tax=Sutcliffiella cohnii TaxID=33932 RepID=A0A223KK02_9BACI|nr:MULTISPECIES: RNA polymerase sigma factor SigY [Sutcliffiella]AST89782.1 RNA polymerase sigma factor SigY [Sutcliffiella cohnii]WBL15407.1 RNA polymerase sigma factor SigY [Sutcliffiella sp. NC1]